MPTLQERVDSGLSNADAVARLLEFGHNDLVPQRPASSLLTWILRLIADPMVVLLTIAGITYFMLGDRFDAIVVMAALVPIFLVTAILEYRSDRALENLRDVSPPRARVRREGEDLLIPARDVVPNDLLVLREGDVVAADAEVLGATHLLVDESALTGESLPVEKHKYAGESGFVLASTIVRSGRGTAIVRRTGDATEYGRIGHTMALMRPQSTPLERSIRRFVVQVGIAVSVVCVMVILIGKWHGDAWPIAIIAGVSLAMAAIPEELPMVYTLYLALGAWRLAKDNALVHRLSSVETLGATTVICVDKTGTLTYGKLSVDSIFPISDATDAEVLNVAALASHEESGDPLDTAILAVAQAPDPLWKRAIDVPFDPARRYAAAIWRTDRGYLLTCKGAFEALAPRAASGVSPEALRFIESATTRGARVIAIARAHLEEGDEAAISTAPLAFVGLIALADEVREDAASAVQRCRSAGIRVVMITGDHPTTARTIAALAGLDATEVCTGDELERWSPSELNEHIAHINVFARIRPEQKLHIVQALHANNEIVAMTGDGTNDALALREAEIGIAMGKGGTEVARSAADLVLLDDDITTIVRAVADGRRIFTNMRHAISYLNAFHAPLLLSAFLLPLIGVPVLLLPIHLIWLELIVHPTSALVFENDPADPNIMSIPPRNTRAGILAPHDWQRALLLGVTLAATVIGVYLFFITHGMTENEARATALITMIFGQVVLVFIERAGNKPLWQVSLRNNPAIVPIVLGTLGSVWLAIAWHPLAEALHMHPIPSAVMAVCAALGCAAVLWTQPFLALSNARGASRRCS